MNRPRNRRTMQTAGILLGLTLVVCGANAANAQWPGWGGPHGNFKADGKIADSWPDGGPRQLWSREIGDAYSSISVDGDRLYTMSREGNKEMAVALDARTGKTIWEHSYPETQFEGLSKQFGEGANSTPLIHGDHVYVAGMGGQLFCLEKETGKEIWHHNLMEEFGATPLIWGYASSPFVYKETLIALVGGEGASIVAFHLLDGKVMWKTESFANGYASPVVINVDGDEQLIAFMAEQVVGLDPSNGKVKWSHPHKTDYGINACNPIWSEDNTLFLSSGYNNGSRMLKLTQVDGKTIVEELWFSRKLKIQFGNAIRNGDHLYFSSGHSGSGFLVGVDAETGALAWRKRGIPRASVIFADGKFIILDEDGKLTLANLNPEGYEAISQVQLLKKVAWTPPSLVNGTLYIRDRKKILALDLLEQES